MNGAGRHRDRPRLAELARALRDLAGNPEAAARASTCLSVQQQIDRQRTCEAPRKFSVSAASL
jgi:hypothetical protein